MLYLGVALCALCSKVWRARWVLPLFLNWLRAVSFLGHTPSSQAGSCTTLHTVDSKGKSQNFCEHCITGFSSSEELTQHNLFWHSDLVQQPPPAPGLIRGSSRRKKPGNAVTKITKRSRGGLGLSLVSATEEDLPVSFSVGTSREEESITGGSGTVVSSAGVVGRIIGEAGEHLCPVCNKGFRYSFNLRRHLNTHTTYFQHRCYICGRGFHRSDFMQRHIRTVHKNIVNSDIP